MGAGSSRATPSSSKSKGSASCGIPSVDSDRRADRIVSVVMENLMAIGEFASASRLSQKALRLYGENGLLPPAWVDPESGYRYYGAEQLQTATLIALLRRAGLPLFEIRTFLRDPTVECLEEFERHVTDEFAERQ